MKNLMLGLLVCLTLVGCVVPYEKDCPGKNDIQYFHKIIDAQFVSNEHSSRTVIFAERGTVVCLGIIPIVKGKNLFTYTDDCGKIWLYFDGSKYHYGVNGKFGSTH